MSIAYASEQLERKFSLPGGLGFARLAEALQREQREEEAVALLGEGLRHHPGQISAYLLLARIHLGAGRLPEARSELEKALAVDGRCPAALKLLGEVCAELQAHGDSARHLGWLAYQEPWDPGFQEAHHRALAFTGMPAVGTAPVEYPSETQSVQEFSLNDVADFLPKEEEADLGLEPGSGTLPAQPMPMDVLREEPAPQAPEAAPAEPAPITGDDVESRFDSFFGLETASAPPDADSFPTGAETAEEMPAGEPTSYAEKDRVEGDDIARRLDDLFKPSEAALESESMPPGSGTEAVEASRILEEAAGTTVEGVETTAEPDPVTGEDIAQRLDSIFSFSSDDSPAAEAKAEQPPLAGLDERTIAMPALSAERPAPEVIAARSVEDATVDADVGLGDESVVETEDLRPSLETRFRDGGSNGEAVVGEDISRRLDQLFGEDDATPFTGGGVESDATETTGVESGTATILVERAPAAEVSGRDVEERLTQIFEGGAETGAPEAQAGEAEASPPVLEMEEDLPGEESAEAEEPPNVATVTLAEIYFQQGLKEQALQIYRQLLEREPENDAVRKRIDEIEATKSGEDRGDAADRRAPRPGLKVPRRKH